MLWFSAGSQGLGPQAWPLFLVQRRVVAAPVISLRFAKRRTCSILFVLLFFIPATREEDHPILNDPDWPSANVTTTSMTERPTILEHAPLGLQRTELSSARSFHGTSAPLHTDALDEAGRRTKVPDLESASAGSRSTSQNLVSPVGTPLDTTKGETMFLHSRSEVGTPNSSASLRLTRVLPWSTSTPSYIASLRKKVFEQTTKKEPHTVQPASNSSSSGVPATLYWPSLSPSLRHSVEAVVHATLPPSVTLMRLVPEKTTGGSIQEPDSQSISFSSDTPVSGTIEPLTVTWSTAMGQSHLDPENFTASTQGLTFPSDGSVTGLPLYSLSEAIAGSSSPQRSKADSTLQGSQPPKTNSELPLRNASSPVTSPRRAEPSLDAANNESIQLETTTHVIPLSVSGMSKQEVLLGAADLDLVTEAVGFLKEASPSLQPPSSLMKEHIESSSATPLSASFGTSKGHEVSLAFRNMLSSFPVKETKEKLKDDSTSVTEAYLGPSVGSFLGTISRDKTNTTSCSYGQTSSTLVSDTVLSEDATGGFKVPLHQTDLWESTANLVDYSELVEMDSPGREGQTTASVKESSTSTLSLSAMKTGSARVTFADSRTEVVFPRKGTGPMPRSRPNFATLVMSPRPALKESSEPITDSSMTTAARFAIIKNDSTLPSLPYLDTMEVLQSTEVTPSSGMSSAGLLSGIHSTSTVVEYSGHSSGRELMSPSQPYATVSLPNMINRSLVTPSHDSLSTSFSNMTGVPEPTLNTSANVTKGFLARTLLAPTNHTDTALSRGSINTTARVAPMLPTEVPKVGLNTSAVMVSLGDTLGYKITDVSTLATPQMIATTSWHVHSTRRTRTLTSEVSTYPLVKTKSIQASSVLSAAALQLTTPRIHPDKSKPTESIVCRTISCPGFFTPSQGSSPAITSQPPLIRKFFSTVSEAMDTKKKETHVLADKVPSPEESSTAVFMSTKIVTGVQDGHSSQQEVSNFGTSRSNQAAREGNLTFIKPTLPVLMVHTLWFRLIRIEYTESLKTRSSESYVKLENELMLMLIKMLSAYESFLQANILRFLNGSVLVESQVVFQGRGLVPTPSDLIRTIVTEVKIQRMDAAFDWKVDVKSLHSNGFGLENLEPENLAMSFTLLGLSSMPAFGDRIIGEHLEHLKSKMKVLLGTRYIVHWISLVDTGKGQSGIDVNGNIFIKSDVHVDISWTLKALMGLSNSSVDLTSLSINGSRLSLQVFPVSFLVTNRIFSEKMLDRSSVEHQNIAKDLSDTLMHVLGKYENLLQVAIREITGGSLMCHGDVIFQYPAPTSKDVLQTLTHSVGPKDYLDSSSFQVDPYSFTVAGTGMEPLPKKWGVPGYAIAIIILSLLVLTAGLVFVWLPKVLGRRDKIIINRVRDTEGGLEVLDFDNPGYHTAFEEGSRYSYIPMGAIG